MSQAERTRKLGKSKASNSGDPDGPDDEERLSYKGAPPPSTMDPSISLNIQTGRLGWPQVSVMALEKTESFQVYLPKEGTRMRRPQELGTGGIRDNAEEGSGCKRSAEGPGPRGLLPSPGP